MLLDLGIDIPLVAFVLLNTTSVGQPRCVEDANLGKRLHILRMRASALTTIPLLLVSS